MHKKTSVTIAINKKSVQPQEAAELYVELGWGTREQYTAAKMRKSLEHCDIVVSAHNEAGELVGIGRALSDFAIDTKILDLIIAPEYQRQGVGLRMMKAVADCAKGTTVYFETEPKNFAFAKKCGYEKRKGLTVFRKKV